MDLENRREMTAPGPFEARYLAFLGTIANLRPSLHRYCSRMTGSVLDGEDVVQEALFRVLPADPPGPALGRAVEHLVLALPPKERACVLLKDVFDYSLEEIAELVDSTVGGVKAALHRGRSRLPAAPEPGAPRRAKSADEARLLHLYVERFNRRDWDGLRELIAADARLRVADRFTGSVGESPYFGRYEGWPVPWRLAVGEVDGEPVVVILMNRDSDEWKPEAVVRLEVTDHRVTRIADYIHCPWILPAAASFAVDSSLSN